MRHCTIQTMLDELMENPEEILVTAASQHCALYGRSDGDGSMRFLVGDFSGSPEEREAEARRLLNNHETTEMVESS